MLPVFPPPPPLGQQPPVTTDPRPPLLRHPCVCGIQCSDKLLEVATNLQLVVSQQQQQQQKTQNSTKRRVEEENDRGLRGIIVRDVEESSDKGGISRKLRLS